MFSVRRACILVICAMCAWTYGQNSAPVVDAGYDQEVGTKDLNSLFGGVIDDDTPAESLTVQWTQISGPAQAQINDPTNTITGVVFTVAGTYRFELRASDGLSTRADTTEAVVHVNLPFKVLSPADGEQILIGAPYVIRWQMDPSKPCLVFFSLDTGKTYVPINEEGSVSDSFTWYVDSSFKDSSRFGIVRVEEYQGPPDQFAEQTFVLVDSADQPEKESGCGCGTGTGLAFLPPLGFKIASLRRRRRKPASRQ